MRRAPQRKPVKPKPGRTDAPHLARVRALRCVLEGKRCRIGKWEGTYPKKFVVREYLHKCVYVGGQSDPHHTVKKSQGGHDHTVVPMCRAAHDEAEALTPKQFLQRWGVALPVVASQLAPKGAP